MSIILAFSLITPVIEPGILNSEGITSVAQAKTYKAKSVRTLRKKYDKIKKNMKLSRVKKILGHKPTQISDSFNYDDGSFMIEYEWVFDASTKKKVVTVSIKVRFGDDGKCNYRTFEQIDIDM